MTGKGSTAARLKTVRQLAAPVVHELCKTGLLLALLAVSLWIILAVFGAIEPGGSMAGRLLATFSALGRDVNGLPIWPRFAPAAGRSLAIVGLAAALLATTSLTLATCFALHPWCSVARLPLTLVSALPAFMFPFLGLPDQGTWWWPAVCLALGDLNLATVTGHCYEQMRRELQQPYLRPGRLLGLGPWGDLWPRASLVTLEAVRARLPHLLGGTVAVELAYNIHGVGALALRAVLAARPDFHVLVWIAALGILVARLLSLGHRLVRPLLTPERGPSTLWQHGRWLAGLKTLWQATTTVGRGRAERLRALAGHTAGLWPLPVRQQDRIPLPTRWGRLRGRLTGYWRMSAASRLKVAGAAMAAGGCLVLAAIVLWGGGYSLLDTDQPNQGPSLAHPLGTNLMGEDVLAIVALGGRQLAGPLLLAVSLAVLVAGLPGTVAGLRVGSALDLAMDLMAELLESVPKLILVLAAVAYMSYEGYVWKLYLVIGAAFAPNLYRAVRDEVAALRRSQFLEAAVTLGLPWRRIVMVHLLRNHVLPVLCLHAAVLVGYVLLFDAILGYCRVRQFGQVFTWGNLLGTGLANMAEFQAAALQFNGWAVWGPLAALVLTIAGSAVAADAIKSMSRSLRFSQT